MNSPPNVFPTDGWGFLFRFQFEELRRAYHAARDASNRERTAIEAKWNELEAKVEAGTAAFIEEDADGNMIVDWGEQAGEALSEIERVQRIYRESFLISLYHFWERELLQRMKKTRVTDAEAYKFLKARGLFPQEYALTTLRLAANVAKHSEGPSAEQLQELRPELFDTEEMEKWKASAGHEYLRITEEVLEAFFEAVRKSGPGHRQPLAMP
jgi:hypothetical protein